MKEKLHRYVHYYGWLSIAISSEVFATFMLVLSAGMSRIEFTMLSIIGYSSAYYCLTHTLDRLPLGFAYALWSGIGVLSINIIDTVFFDDPLNIGSLLGMGLIIIGVLCINMFSNFNSKSS